MFAVVSIFVCVVFSVLSVPGVGHSVLSSVLGHVQSLSGHVGHVVCSSASVGTVSHCDVEHVSSGRLSINYKRWTLEPILFSN